MTDQDKTANGSDQPSTLILPESVMQRFYNSNVKRNVAIMDGTDIALTLAIVGAYFLGWVPLWLALVSIAITLVFVVGMRLLLWRLSDDELPEGIEVQEE